MIDRFHTIRLSIAVILGLIMSSVPANAEDDSPFSSVVTAFWTGGADKRVELVADESAPGVDIDLLAKTRLAAPPPDPEMPAWGHYLDPITPPVTQQPVEYGLIGPPTGVIQHSDEQGYRAVVSDPNTVFGCDSQIGQTIDLYRPDGMAPVGVFADHTLAPGSTYISYRYLQNVFEQNYVGSHRTSPPAGFPFAPRRMLQDSQVALIEYGVTQDWTVLAMLPFQHNEISSNTATGDYKTTFTNPGDIRIMGLLVLTRGDRSQSHANFGLSVPVGFLDKITTVGGTPVISPTDPNLPYQLRTSSGTYDLIFGYTYRKQTDFWTFGAQANGVIPTGKNSDNYELGNQAQITSWIARRWTERWSTSARLDAHYNGNIRGADPRLVTTLSPDNQADAQARYYLNGLLGVNYLLTRPECRIREQRLYLEGGIPLYQWVDGPQLGLSWTLNAGWGMVF